MSFRRKLMIIVLAVAGSLSLAASAVWLNSGKGKQAGMGGRGPGPKVTFAEGARTGNAELDTFVRDFVELCVKGDYDNFRLCWTTHAPQISSSRFRAIWDAADKVLIKEIASVPGKAKGKAYVVKASATLNAQAKEQHRDVDVLVLREEGKWVIAPAPSTLRDDGSAASQPEQASSGLEPQ